MESEILARRAKVAMRVWLCATLLTACQQDPAAPEDSGVPHADGGAVTMDAGADGAVEDAAMDSAVGADSGARMDAGTGDGGPDSSADSGRADADAGALDAGSSCGDVHAAGSWEMLGGPFSVLPGATGASQPSIAVEPDGTALVAFQERQLTSTGANRDIYVERWDGSDWVLVGLTLSSYPGASSASAPSLMIDDAGRPLVAWTEAAPDGGADIFVRRWEAGVWVPLGGAIRGGAGVAQAVRPILVPGEGEGYVLSWAENVSDASGWSGSVYVAQWDGTTWAVVGGPVATGTGDARVAWPKAAIAAGGTPYLVWNQGVGPTRYENFVSRWNGLVWERVGPALSEFADGWGPNTPDLMFGASGAPVVAYAENDDMGGALLSPISEVFVRRWDGSTWLEEGSPSRGVPGLSGSHDPHLGLDASGSLIVSYQASGLLAGTYVRRWSGSAWLPLGPPGSVSTDDTAAGQTMSTTPCGDPILAWVQSTRIGREVVGSIVVSRYVR